jgi:hypothetical protein
MRKYLRPLVVVVGVIVIAGAVYGATSCAGKGVSFAEAEVALKESCVQCHTAQGIGKLVTDVKAIDGAQFTDSNFPDSYFPDGLRGKTVDDLIKAADPKDDANIDPKTPQRQAWVLHELHELEEHLGHSSGMMPPDFTSQQSFDAFNTSKSGERYAGCDTGEKLDLGHKNDPEGMPPQWAPKLMELLKTQFKALEAAQRQKIRDYLDSLLPGGLKSCTPGQGSVS